MPLDALFIFIFIYFLNKAAVAPNTKSDPETTA